MSTLQSKKTPRLAILALFFSVCAALVGCSPSDPKPPATPAANVDPAVLARARSEGLCLSCARSFFAPSEASPRQCSSCGTSTPIGNHYCTSCAARDRVCTQCGTSLKPETEK